MKEIKIVIKDATDVSLLLSGINLIRKGNLASTQMYLALPKRFNKEKIMDELVDDYDRSNMLGAQLSKILEDQK